VRTIGLIGGCSAESTSIYYARINQLVRERRPGHGAKLLLWSFDFDEIDACCRTGDWDLALEKFAHAAGWLRAGGAEAIVLCTNTMHRIAEPLTARLDAPLIHIVDETAVAIKAAGLSRPILLGTRFTMTEAFYRQRLQRFGFEVFLPDAAEQDAIHAVIYDELIAGQITDAGQRTLTAVIERLAEHGADSVVLGCTELGLLIRPGDVSAPVFDTAEIHIAAAVAFTLDEAKLERTSVG
jgi:aspartate racemase